MDGEEFVVGRAGLLIVLVCSQWPSLVVVAIRAQHRARDAIRFVKTCRAVNSTRAECPLARNCPPFSSSSSSNSLSKSSSLAEAASSARCSRLIRLA